MIVVLPLLSVSEEKKMKISWNPHTQGPLAYQRRGAPRKLEGDNCGGEVRQDGPVQYGCKPAQLSVGMHGKTQLN